jgi:hypothetical protein
VHGAISSLLQYIFMMLCLIKHKETLSFMLYTNASKMKTFFGNNERFGVTKFHGNGNCFRRSLSTVRIHTVNFED